MLHLVSKSGVSSLAFRPRLQRRSLAQYSYVGDGIDCHPKHQTTWDCLVKKFQGPAKPGTLILVRHGESEWNQKRLFTGWVDVDLSDRGIREIEHASRLLLERGYTVDVTYTSVLKRAVRSSWIMLNEINQIYRPVKKSWRLNERMYGALEGHSKVGLASLYGEEVVQKWRAGLADKPPPMSPDHPYWHGLERKYSTIPASCIPTTESLQDTIDRTVPLWDSHILPDLRAGRNVLIVAHRNSIRGILKHIDGINTEDIQQVSVPNGIPLVYKFDSEMRPIVHKNAVKPLSGIWLGKTGLLRAALDQEAELAKRIEGYSYAPSGNKYDTRTFYYHAPYANFSGSSAIATAGMDIGGIGGAGVEIPAGNHSNSKYSAREEADLDELSPPSSHVSHGSHSSMNASGNGAAAHSNPSQDGALFTTKDLTASSQGMAHSTVIRGDAAMLDTAYGGSDVNLVRKLIMLEQERKMFDLIDDKNMTTIPTSDVYDSYQKYNNSDIYVDPMIFKYGIPEHVRQAALMVPKLPRSANASAGASKVLEKVDAAKLNRIVYFADDSPSTATAVAGSSTASAVPVGGDPATIGVAADALTAATAASISKLPDVHPLLQRPLLVIIRHGKTEHNKLGLFTGWEDASLSPEGRVEARIAGKLLRKHGVKFDLVYTSWLSRAIETAWLVMNELDALWMPIIKTWRLNERMYGALTGLSKKMIRQIYGEAQFKRWRRGYDEPPPPISSFSSAYPGNDGRYVKYVTDMPVSLFETCIRSLAHGELELHRAFPKSESLKDCMERTIPFFMKEIEPDSLQQGKNVLIASSENAIRGLLMHLCKIPSDRIHAVEIPTGLPLVYDSQLGKIRLLQEEGPDGTYMTGPELLQKYNFGDSPELLFEPTKVDIPFLHEASEHVNDGDIVSTPVSKVEGTNSPIKN